MSSSAIFDPQKVCKRASIIFNHYLKNPETIQHMILYGPPGAGKTTTAEWFVNEFWRDYPLKQEVILILNAADERSLEAIRQKMYPFAEAQAMACSLYNKPKFIILDECETLTETAQLALRPLLEYQTNELCLIFICNSLTRVQKQLMNHFLQIRFDPPKISDFRSSLETNRSLEDPPKIGNFKSSLNKNINTLDTIEWRNDYRKQNEMTNSITEESRTGLTRFIHYLLSPPRSTPPLLEFKYDLSRTLRWCILLAYELNIDNTDFYDTFECLSNPDIQTEHTDDLIIMQETLFNILRTKFDSILPPL
jgi:predicted AAA+ superfamily ATPase